ncbi:MAG TPA: metalloregulator ArsR/SmtB family transcription factor [Acidimicrobiia bacterium]|nr:metalloregulator ArsR/SmtB family transcription factor [Acidimicrobiia bacterium]
MTDPQPVLAALADPTRRAVFERLNNEGPATASQLASELPVSRQAISKHLGQLDAAGLVDRVSSGREVLYSAQVGPLGDIAGWMEQVGSDWDDRLQRLKESFD